jgi:hypothetical protein
VELQLIWLICACETKKIGWFDAEASWKDRGELGCALMKCLERRCSPNEGLSTLDAPDGTAAGGLNEIVPCDVANVAQDRPTRLNERLYIANECIDN